ncbi:MAG: 4Fe-4S binding protein [Actinomycetota bacterium]
MPWVDKDNCTGCGTCIEGCPIEAISMIDQTAEIDMGRCMRKLPPGLSPGCSQS